jgi:putative Mg2+ transporter-C (MgtC) family protein
MREFNIYSIIFRLFLATILSGIMGYERGRRGRAAGLRTHILVCVGATIASMTGPYIATHYIQTGDVSRIAAQVISGIGFLGAGTILVRNNSTVTGLTTAACVWATGTIGIAIGYGFYEAAVIGALIAYLTIRLLSGIEQKSIRLGKEFNLYVEFIDANKLNDTIFMFKERGYKVETIALMPSKSNLPNSIAASITVKVKQKENVQDILADVSKIENVNFAIVNYSILL